MSVISAYGWLAILGVALSNIILNVLARCAARSGVEWFRLWSHWPLWGCFLVGLVSLSCLVAVYRSGAALAGGVLWMGALSTLAGSLLGVVALGETLTKGEWALWAGLLVYYLYRLQGVVAAHQGA